MFKHLLNIALMAACLFLVMLIAVGMPLPISTRALGLSMIFVGLLILAWPLLRHTWRRLVVFLGLGALALSLSACAALGGGAGGQAFTDLVKAIATDPRCGHDDNLQFVAGVLSGSAARHCPIPNAAAAPPLAVGTVVAPTTPPSQ